MYYKDNDESDGGGALILSIISLLAWLLPIAGIPISIIGLVLGIKANYATKGQVAIALSIIGLILAIINSAIGAIQGSQSSYY